MLEPGKMKSIEINGKSILLVNLNARYYAIGNICTHMGCRLSDGTLTGETVQCPCHGSIFNVTTGAVVRGPAQDPEQSYPLKIEQDQVLVIL